MGEASEIKDDRVSNTRRSPEYARRPLRCPKITFASCVDSIKQNFKKIGGRKDVPLARKNTIIELPEKENQKIRPCLDKERSKNNNSKKNGASGQKSSFEIFLSMLPKVDPVDRTVGWVLKQPDEMVHAIAGEGEWLPISSK